MWCLGRVWGRCLRLWRIGWCIGVCGIRRRIIWRGR
ncbi:hypothetical protein PMIN01_07577 [Paraphaeosphaeria minitans]|uniref:Uncharacterized protein n=1 Tax=Paraphaeosphaeria minitans TaxID=565426 RepID=A0A9P6GIA6_9PLEO|nr:hypothetical protein PMIN01_07577 [Paraphaeosphaeria minitans]